MFAMGKGNAQDAPGESFADNSSFRQMPLIPISASGGVHLRKLAQRVPRRRL